MIYALNLAEDNRILSACVVLPSGKHEYKTIVEILPDGDVTDYRYVSGEYIHDPKPKPPAPDPKPTQEDRITALEEALTAIGEGIASV